MFIKNIRRGTLQTLSLMCGVLALCVNASSQNGNDPTAEAVNLTQILANRNASYYPPPPYRMLTGEVKLIRIIISNSYHGKLSYQPVVENGKVVIPSLVNVTSLQSWIGAIETNPEPANVSGGIPSYTTVDNDLVTMDTSGYKVVTISLKARRLGKSYITLPDIVQSDNATSPLLVDVRYDVIVMRNSGIAETIYFNTLLILLVLINFCFGCDLDLKVVWGFVKKPIPPVIGFACQFLCMPLIGLAVTQILQLDPIYGFGLIALSCAPGGGASNSWTLLLGGDLNLSLTMTFLSITLALGMMPLWLFVVSRIYFDPSQIEIPFLNIFITLLQFIVPCFFGVGFRRLRERWAKNVARLSKPLCLFFLLWVFTFGIYVNLYMWELMGENPKIIPAGIILPWLGFGLGFLIATLCRQTRMRAVTIAIETGIQNIGIPIIMLQQKFPQPEGDMAAAVANSVGLFTPVPLYIALIVLTIRRRCFPPDDKLPLPTEDDTDLEIETSGERKQNEENALNDKSKPV